MTREEQSEKCVGAGSEEGEGPVAKEGRQPLAGKGRRAILPSSLQKEQSPADTDFRSSDLWNCKIINCVR